MSVIGQPVIRVSSEPEYDPNGGFQTRERWRGERNAIESLAAAYTIAGYPNRVTDEGGAAWLDVAIGLVGEAQTEVPVDSWGWAKDFAVQDIWSHPNIFDIMSAYATTWGVGVDDAVAYFRKICEAALKGKKVNEVSALSAEGDTFDDVSEGPVLPVNTGFTGNLLKVYTLLSRGTEGFEFERVELERVRSFSIVYSQRMTLDAIPKVYTSSALITTFGIPAIIVAQLPTAPATSPSDTAWSWKLRSQTSRVNFRGKVEETQRWTFAAWSTLTHTLQS